MRAALGWSMGGLLALATVGLAAGHAEPPAPTVATEGAVRLRSGRVFYGRVAGMEVVQGATLVRVATDFGIVLLPQKEVAKEEAPVVDPGAAFRSRSIWVLRIQGTVERQRRGATEWTQLAFHDDRYGAVLNSPNALLDPGDRARTGKDAWLEILLHKDAWVRVAPESEIEIPAGAEAKASLHLLQGTALQRLNGRPRGETYRVRTPTALLGARGTSFVVNANEEVVLVREGIVDVEGRGEVRSGHAGRWAAGGPIAVTPLTPSETELATFDRPTVSAGEMVFVKGGTYSLTGDMPGPSTELARYRTAMRSDHRTLSVTVPDFLIDRDEVTDEEYAAFVGAFGQAPLTFLEAGVGERLLAAVEYTDPAHRRRDGRELGVPKAPFHWETGKPRRGEERVPVYDVSWAEAQAFLRWRGKQLPTEAEWEVAARGPQGDYFPWGNTITMDQLSAIRGEEMVWYLQEEAHFAQKTVSTVDTPTLDVSAWGVRGMISRAPEWVRDWWTDSPFAAVAMPGAWDAAAGLGPREREAAKVIRGVDGSARTRMPGLADPRPRPLPLPGFRGVIELR